jgi:hypothetical protein
MVATSQIAPDDAALGARAAPAGRAALRAGQDQRDPPGDHRRGDCALGIKVSIVEVKDVEIPTGMQRAMARQAEAERERRAKVIAPRASSRLRAAEGRRARDRGPPDRAAAALPPDAARARLVAVDDDRLPGADRPADSRSSRDSRAPEHRAAGRPALRAARLVAPGRSSRPGAGVPARAGDAEELESCPFCEGREDRTPPEVLALAERGPRPTTPVAGAGRPEQVPGLRAPGGRDPLARHRRSLRSSTTRSSSWSPRPGGSRAAREAGYRTSSPGQRGPNGRREPAAQPLAARLARRGAPLAAAERGARLPRCEYSSERDERARGRGTRRPVLLCPHAGRAPYECLVAPLEHEPDASPASAGAALALPRRRCVASRARGPAAREPLATRERALAPRAPATPDRLRVGSSSAPGSTSTRSRPKQARRALRG